MAITDVNDFTRERECIYEGECYSVRDNGAVFRHQRIEKRVRTNDNQWTFGKENSSNPYLHISDVRIHRIVATAFYGEPPDPQYVVDHIDTNCRNNRPENLRWVSRMDNVLLNPASRKRIVFRCGSVEAFIENPSMLNTQSKQSFAWMRPVTAEEARNCKEHISLWASTDMKPRRASLGEWVYKPIRSWEISGREPGLEVSQRLTRRNAKNMWIADYYYPCYPEETGTNPMEAYFANLKVGAVFACNDDSPKLIILEFVKTKNNSSILIMCEREGSSCEMDGFYPWSIFEITLVNVLFVHTKLGSYFEKNDADNEFCIKQELECRPVSTQVPDQIMASMVGVLGDLEN